MKIFRTVGALVIGQSISLMAAAFCQAQQSVPAQVHNTVPPEMQDTGGQGLFDDNGNLFMEEVVDPKAKPKQKPKMLPIDLSRVGVSVNERGEIVPLRDADNPTGIQRKFNVVEQTNELLPGYYPGLTTFYPGANLLYPGYMPYPGYNRFGLNINIPLGGGRSLSFGPNYGPYGPYGFNPYGVNPYGFNPYGFNPYANFAPYSNFNPYQNSGSYPNFASPYGAVSPYGNIFPSAPYAGFGLNNGFGFNNGLGLNSGFAPNYNSMWKSFNLSF